MKRWVVVADGQITFGPVGGETPPSEEYIPYEEIIDLPDDHGEVFVSVAVADNVCTKRVFAVADYAKQRKAAYPPVEDFLDAVVKGDETAMEAYRQTCLEIKAKYPKP